MEEDLTEAAQTMPKTGLDLLVLQLLLIIMVTELPEAPVEIQGTILTFKENTEAVLMQLQVMTDQIVELLGHRQDIQEAQALVIAEILEVILIVAQQ